MTITIVVQFVYLSPLHFRGCSANVTHFGIQLVTDDQIPFPFLSFSLSPFVPRPLLGYVNLCL